MTTEEIKEIAYIAWKGAANAHRMYPENKHTFSEYWRGAESQFNRFMKPNTESLPCRFCDAKFIDEYDLEAHVKFNH